MSDRVLQASGAIIAHNEDNFTDSIEIDGDAEIDELSRDQLDKPILVINFPASADGRGFSLAASLRESLDSAKKLYATGKLNPDQLSLAFQCGFDGVIVDNCQWERYGEEAWTQAMDPVINQSYLRSHWNQLDSIWERRANQQVH